MRLGAKLPNSGPLPSDPGIPAMARTLEETGFDSLWVSDHVVQPAEIRSPYPFAADGKATWSTSMPWFDALVALALAAAVTDRARLGTAVLVLPQRHPVEFANQAASIDRASGGRLTLGVGAGWLREEFDALGAPFERRGRRLTEWMEIARDCWTGRTAGRSSEDYQLPADIICQPTPVQPGGIPFLIGGHSRAALRRAGADADGWLAHRAAPALASADVAAGVAALRSAARAAGRDPAALRVVLRIVESAGQSGAIAGRLAELARAGVDEVIVDVDWDAGDPAGEFERLRNGVA